MENKNTRRIDSLQFSVIIKEKINKTITIKYIKTSDFLGGNNLKNFRLRRFTEESSELA